jgi:hypothetical protein
VLVEQKYCLDHICKHFPCKDIVLAVWLIDMKGSDFACHSNTIGGNIISPSYQNTLFLNWKSEKWLL